MQIVLIRQRPAIGDCLLLSAVTRELKVRYPDSHLTCITDGSYAYGGMVEALRGLPGVDAVESVSPLVWTTESNKRIDKKFECATGDAPESVQFADLILDANGHFIEFEREHKGIPPFGIAEFWAKFFDCYTTDEALLPTFNIPSWAEKEAEAFMPEGKCVGVVLRAGHVARNWDYEMKSTTIAAWLHTTGYVPIGIDTTSLLQSPYGKSCNGKRLSVTAAIIKRCAAILTPDTGILHVAQAVGTPSVSMWGVMPPELRTKGYNTLAIPGKSKGVCGPNKPQCECQWPLQRWSCMRRININDIIDALQQVLS